MKNVNETGKTNLARAKVENGGKCDLKRKVIQRSERRGKRGD